MGKIGWNSIRKRSRGTIFPKRRKGYESELALNFGFSQIAASLIRNAKFLILGKSEIGYGPDLFFVRRERPLCEEATKKAGVIP